MTVECMISIQNSINYLYTNCDQLKIKKIVLIPDRKYLK